MSEHSKEMSTLKAVTLWSIVPVFLLWLQPPGSIIEGVLMFVVYMLFWPAILVLLGIPFLFMEAIPREERNRYAVALS